MTQSFSTTSSVGRLTLNLLVTFAQFEREQIAERTKDKMRAARRKGMWTGGPTPWGYQLFDHKLVVDAEQAGHVRAMFAAYMRSGSVTRAMQFASQWRRFDIGSMRRFLSSPTLAGLLQAGDEIVEGQHEAIVDREVWDAAQARLKQRPPAMQRGARSDSLLAGLVRCGCGASMQPHYSHRHGRRYAYFVCTKLLKVGAKACPGSRVAEADLERFVIDRVFQLGRDPALVAAVADGARTELAARGPALETALAALGAGRARLSKEHANVVDAIADGGGRALVERLNKIEANLAGIDVREQELRADLAALQRAIVDEAAVRDAMAAMEPVWGALEHPEKRRVLVLVVECVEYRLGDVSVTFRPAGVGAL